jgi:hypothetical protein
MAWPCFTVLKNPSPPTRVLYEGRVRHANSLIRFRDWLSSRRTGRFASTRSAEPGASELRCQEGVPRPVMVVQLIKHVPEDALQLVFGVFTESFRDVTCSAKRNLHSE